MIVIYHLLLKHILQIKFRWAKSSESEISQFLLIVILNQLDHTEDQRHFSSRIHQPLVKLGNNTFSQLSLQHYPQTHYNIIFMQQQMNMRESNEAIANFRIRSLERPFCKTDAFEKCKSMHKQNTPQINSKNNKKEHLRNVPPLPPTSNNKGKLLKRIIPKKLNPSNIYFKKDTIYKSQNQFMDGREFPDIPITCESLFFEQSDEVFSTRNLRKAFWPAKSKILMIKQIKISYIKSQLTLLRDLKHQNLMELVGFQCSKSSTFFFFEHMKCGSLQSMIDSFGSFSNVLVKKVTSQLIRVVEYLHSIDCIHGGIRLQNIFFDETGNIKLSFPLFLNIIDNRKEGSTLKQQSPSKHKYAQNTKPSKKSDIFSIGLIVLSMVKGNRLISNKQGDQQVYNQEFIKEVWNQKNETQIRQKSQQIYIFLQKCFQLKAGKRTCIKQLVKFAFVQNTQ